ncbi:putative uncharacterized protein FLJ46214 [Pipra filicauda]|uniref:Uncharacterized protein n=1 Tax=Pipra filicauda TaxID=649802 RepID=A0A6J2INM8_9PASS|nr:putative uncharacterized protein FLJ46214 [Pipra filicauda]
MDPTNTCPIDLRRDGPQWPLGRDSCNPPASWEWSPHDDGVHIPLTLCRGNATLRCPRDGAPGIMVEAPHRHMEGGDCCRSQTTLGEVKCPSTRVGRCTLPTRSKWSPQRTGGGTHDPREMPHLRQRGRGCTSLTAGERSPRADGGRGRGDDHTDRQGKEPPRPAAAARGERSGASADPSPSQPRRARGSGAAQRGSAGRPQPPPAALRSPLTWMGSGGPGAPTPARRPRGRRPRPRAAAPPPGSSLEMVLAHSSKMDEGVKQKKL